jgi:hypothetical protein
MLSFVLNIYAAYYLGVKERHADFLQAKKPSLINFGKNESINLGDTTVISALFRGLL